MKLCTQVLLTVNFIFECGAIIVWCSRPFNFIMWNDLGFDFADLYFLNLHTIRGSVYTISYCYVHVGYQMKVLSMKTIIMFVSGSISKLLWYHYNNKKLHTLNKLGKGVNTVQYAPILACIFFYLQFPSYFPSLDCIVHRIYDNAKCSVSLTY